MSSQPIIIQLTQGIIDAIGSGKTITPEKIVSEIGQTYDKDSNYIFEIKEDITIPTGKTLKDFKNIVVNPTTTNITINNEGTIEDCIITLNSIKVGNTTYYIKIYNNYYTDSNINNCTITLNDYSKFYNNDSITGCSITLNDYSEFYNNGNINGDSIILNNESKIYNNNGYIIKCTITLNNSSEFYNNDNNIIKCTII